MCVCVCGCLSVCRSFLRLAVIFSLRFAVSVPNLSLGAGGVLLERINYAEKKEERQKKNTGISSVGNRSTESRGGELQLQGDWNFVLGGVRWSTSGLAIFSSVFRRDVLGCVLFRRWRKDEAAEYDALHPL